MTQRRAVHSVHATDIMIKHSAVLSLVLNQGHRYRPRHVTREAATLLVLIAITPSKTNWCHVLACCTRRHTVVE